MREKQIHREVYWAISLTLGYLAAWAGTAYFLPHQPGLFGFPLWFEAACLAVPLLFILAILWVVKAVFQPLSLEVDDE